MELLSLLLNESFSSIWLFRVSFQSMQDFQERSHLIGSFISLLVTLVCLSLLAIYGFQVGSFQSYSRVLVSRVIPMGHEGEFFSFFELTDKGTTWIGPLLLAVLIQVADIRWGIFLILNLLIGGFILLMTFNEAKAIEEAKRFKTDKKITLDNIELHVESQVEDL